MRVFWPMVVLAGFVAACGSEPDATTTSKSGPFEVATTFYPTTYFAERIAGDDARVVCPLPDGEDPIFWMPDEAALGVFQAADLIVVNGAEFEKWIDKVSLPESRVVRTADGFADAWMKFEHAVTHQHGPGGAHAHTGVDGHTWVDPVHAVVQADAIRAALALRIPAHADDFARRFVALKADLDSLGEALRGLGAVPEGRWLYASHPAYNYVARRYGWPVVNLGLDPGALPGDEEFASIRAKLAEKPASFLVWEAPPLPEIAARFERELGLTSVVFSPCETPDPDGRDYLAVMRANVEALRPVFAGP